MSYVLLMAENKMLREELDMKKRESAMLLNEIEVLKLQLKAAQIQIYRPSNANQISTPVAGKKSSAFVVNTVNKNLNPVVPKSLFNQPLLHADNSHQKQGKSLKLRRRRARRKSLGSARALSLLRIAAKMKKKKLEPKSVRKLEPKRSFKSPKPSKPPSVRKGSLPSIDENKEDSILFHIPNEPSKNEPKGAQKSQKQSCPAAKSSKRKNRAEKRKRQKDSKRKAKKAAEAEKTRTKKRRVEPKYQIGQKVEAKVYKGRKFYPAVIVKVNPDDIKKFTVLFGDGSTVPKKYRGTILKTGEDKIRPTD